MARLFLFLFALVANCSTSYVVASQARELPKLGEAAGSTLSVQQEQIIGDQIMSQIRRSQQLVKDSLINDYIQQLGYRLVAANPDALGRRFKFFVIQDSSINAFALPGGYIGIHTGLITAARNESELASVLGHEVAHVTQRHLARRLEKQGQLSLPSILGLIGSLIIATQDSEAGIAGIAATQAASTQSLINHTRENEKEADRIGIAMLSSAGFDVRAAAAFFETMQSKSRYSYKPPEILLTHPLSRKRINDARTREKLYPIIEQKSSIEFNLVKARITSLTKISDKKYFSYLEKQIKNNPNPELGILFQYAELAKVNGKQQLAVKTLEQLYNAHSNNQSLLFSLAEAHIANHSSDKALPLLLKEMQRTPGSNKLLLITANTYLSLSKASEAESLLLRYIETNKTNLNYLFTLAQTQQQLGRIPEMHETSGQYLLLLGDYRGAKRHFELALSKFSTDQYAQTRIQARLNNVRERMRILIEQRPRFI